MVWFVSDVDVIRDEILQLSVGGFQLSDLVKCKLSVCLYLKINEV